MTNYWYDDFISTYTLGKSLKQQYYLMNDKAIMGTDKLYGMLSVIYLDKPCSIDSNISFKKNSLVDFIKHNENYTFNENEYSLCCNDNVFYLVNDISNNILQLYSRVCEVENINNLLYTRNNLRDDDNFNNIISYKKNDGMSVYNIENRFIMTLFSGIFPINKSDTVDLNIYHVDSISYLSKFIIHKKKYDILLYIRFRYLT